MRASTTNVRARDARRWLLLTDALLIAGGIVLAIGLRRLVGIDPDQRFEWTASHRPLFVAYALLLLFRLDDEASYERHRSMHRFDDMLVLLRAGLTAAAFAVFLSLLTDGFFLGYYEYSRWYVALGFGLPLGLLAVARLGAYELQAQASEAGRFVARVLVFGTGPRAAEFACGLQRAPHLGLLPVRSDLLDENPDAVSHELTRVQPDEVVLAFEDPHPKLQAAVVRECALRGISVRVLPGVFEAWHSQFFRYGGVPVTTLVATPAQRLGRVLKGAFDRGSAALGLILLGPVLIPLAIAIRLDTPGPAVYKQPRVGKHGREFQVWKFRSMRADAEERLADLLERDPDAKAEWDRDQKLKDDPRVTRLGRLIRKWSLDELPQLVNVLMGDMSLVGPRPPMPDQVDHYGVKFVFSQAKPGITGLWQVSGRNQLSFEERVNLDAYYVENWSFRLDVLILLKTVMVVLRREGAY